MQWFRVNRAICFFADCTNSVAFLFGVINANTSLTVERIVLKERHFDVLRDLSAYHGLGSFDLEYSDVIYVVVPR